VDADRLDDLALARLSVPARLPGGLSRRRFLQLAGAGAGAVAAGNALGPLLGPLEAFAAPPVGPRDGILVLVMLDGGNDGLNTVIPYADARYAALRPHIRVPAAQVLKLNAGTGLHPALPTVKSLYDQGKVAVVQGVGYQPADLSHFTSMGIWMNAWSGPTPTGAPTGWVGRYLDGLPNAANESLLGVVVGTSVPLHMVGANTRASGLPERIDGAFGVDRSESANARMFDSISAFSSGPSGLGPLGDMVATVERDTLDLAQRIQPAYQGTFPSTRLGRQLSLCAKLINANLGIRVFSTALGGFDTHSDQGGPAGNHANLLTELDGAIGAFYATLAATYRSRVTLMTFSEFGRRPEDNDTSGTDHGTASPILLVGDRVRGGLHSTQPGLAANQLDRNGNLVRTIDFRQVYAAVLDQWLKADSQQVLGYRFDAPALFAAGGPGGGATTVPTRPVRRRRKRLTV
jgi:uncharacterized protein (DUF1501 family)